MEFTLIAFLVFTLYSTYKMDKKVEEMQQEELGGKKDGNKQVFLPAPAKKGYQGGLLYQSQKGVITIQSMKERLKKGEQVTGTMVTVFENPEIATILKVCGFDFFIVDCEHGTFDYSQVAGICALAREAQIPSLVRIPEVRREVVLRYMEMGARGLLLPNTERVEQARALVEYSKYYPLGNRGVSLLRAHCGFEKPASANGYMQETNEETVLMVQIESPVGVENVEALLEVEGIDAAFIGPNDLSQSMGIMGQMDNSRFIEAVDTVIAAAKKKRKYSGIHLPRVEDLLPWMEKGMTLNLWSNDIILMMDAARAGMARLKG